MVGDTPEQATEIELSWVGLGDTTLGRRGEPTAGDDHAVISIRSGSHNKPSLWIDGALDKTGGRADGNRLGWIVKPRVKDDHVAPQGVVGNYHGVTDAEGDSQILPSLPGVLREPLPHVGAKDGVRAVADFRIGVKQSQSGVGDCHARPAGTAIGEQELAILVVRASRAS